MSLLTEIVPIVLSFCGILAGIGLSYLASEELQEGKKYFLLFSQLLFIALSIVISFFLLRTAPPYLLFIFLFLAILFFIINLKIDRRFLIIFPYLLFLTAYFLSGKELLVAALLFVYGLPIGTLLRMKNEQT